MAVRLTQRPLSRENIHISESDKIFLLPSRNLYNTEADDAAERDLRDAPTLDRTNDFTTVCLMLAFAAGAATVLIIGAVGWAISTR